MRLPVARSRPMGPPRPSMPLRAPFQNNFGTGQMPGIRPPKGMVERLNRAKLKDFMALGQFLLHRRTKPSDMPLPEFNYMGKEQVPVIEIRSRNLLAHFLEEEKNTTARRKIMFSSSPLTVLNGCCGVVPYSIEDLSPFTVKSHNVHMRFDHLLSFEYTKNLPGFESLSPADRITVFRYVIMGFCALDIAFLTSQMKMTERVLTEYAALKALTLWRTCYFELSPAAKLLAKEHEYSIIKGLHEYYKDRPEGPERMGAVILFIGNIFVGGFRF
ncbi:hypothetical protein FO519_008480 [Halicephalobus sp. NKZ332]|nr:hypothetical protein FO519_008480 [Halicephalobus sp. NKZ332]